MGSVWPVEIVTDIRLHFGHPVQAIKRQLAAITNLEWIVIAGIIAVLIALLAPQTQWASSGSIRLPVRVFVFDTGDSLPVAGANAMVIGGPSAANPDALAELHDRVVSEPMANLPKQYYATTDANGVAVIEHEFSTGASHKRPVSHAHLNFTWVRVEAPGYSSVVVPVWHESQPTALLRKQGEIPVQVGLTAR